MKDFLQKPVGKIQQTHFEIGRSYILQKFLLFSFFMMLAFMGAAQKITGEVADSTGQPLQKVTVVTDHSRKTVLTDQNGNYSIPVTPADKKLTFSFVGMTSVTKNLTGEANYNITLIPDVSGLADVVVVGYGTKKKEAITGAVSSITSKDIDRVHAGSNVSTTLAGKLPGVTFRMPDGRPGSGANIQIRNMGTPLYVIDGIQEDEGQFNNLAPTDIESITILKDASAAIYGVRAANGVVVITTKKGTTGKNTVNVDAYYGVQQWFRFPKVVTNSYDYERYLADAQMNTDGKTSITQTELDKYKQGASAGKQYRSFDWRKFVMSNNNAPQNQVNININGGSDKVNYYVSGTNFFQNSVLGSEYKFNRSNIQSNITAKLATGLKVGLDINGRIETRENPGVPGQDDYFLAKFAVLRNTPLERPYANDNPAYLNDIGHIESNYAFLNKKLSGTYHSDWRVLQTNFHVDYNIAAIPGLSVRALYSYYIADYLLNNHEYTYHGYVYIDSTQTYKQSGGSSNPWREREQIKQINTTAQGQINYNASFGNHTIAATVVAERLQSERLRNWIHASPVSNNLPLIYFPTADTYQDSDDKQARIGYIGRISYSYANKYFLDLSARRDASYLFAPGNRVGYFPGVSAGWRITDEPFMQALLHNKKDVLTDLKFRGSYGILGDDNPNNTPIVAPYAYLPGYNYNQGTAIIDGNPLTVSRDKGVPTTNISWLKSRITDIGLDAIFLKGKLNATFDYFYRKRTGLLGNKNDVIVPQEIGYSLPQENINSDAQYGGEMSAGYNSHIGKLFFNVGGNVSYTKSKFLNSYKPLFFNSLDQYRNSSEQRFNNTTWGYTVIGQFTSQDQINNYKVNIDGKGNRTLLPGDLIYKDFNGDGKIDVNDERPIGFGYGTQPMINFGFTIGGRYNSLDFHIDFSGAAGYTWFQNWESRWAFQNNGNLNAIFEDRWHRADPFDLNSAWIPGKYPPNRVNPGHGHSDYGGPDGNQWNSTFWLHNVKQLRARTLEVGYSLPTSVIERLKIQKARFYLNAYNLFSLDNLKQYGVDPEVIDDNGLQFPQNRVLNVGLNITL
ncbi:MAG: SusC/RagA family TonB-linked outer membrane protein [Bacteroidota bacterium]|nr:SusC/RagA family TonB-linked outer membrane protein [Bacteroidota bacterium]